MWEDFCINFNNGIRNSQNTLNKMNNKKFVWSCIVMTFFTACNQAEVENQNAVDLRLSITASIKGQEKQPVSRYVGDDPSMVDFEQGDRIGVFVDDNPASLWVLGQTGWNPNVLVYWPDKVNDHIFRAFYPYAEASSVENVPMPSLKTQSGTVASISSCDFLVASVTERYEKQGETGRDGVVDFRNEHSFEHVSSLLQLSFRGDGDLKSSTLEKIQIEGADIVAPSTYSFLDRKVSTASDASSDVLTVLLSHAMNGQDATFFFILNEKKDVSPVVLTVEYSSNGKHYVASMENFAGNFFEGGMCQSYTFTIKDSSLIISGSSISPWGEGETLDDIVINGEERHV